MRVGFVVEGISDKKLIESASFKSWAKRECGLEIIDEVVNAGGNGNMCVQKIGVYIQKLIVQTQPDKVVVLADLDPERCAPCISERKKLIGTKDIDLVVIARKAMESWFLADTEAMRKWLNDVDFYENQPEETKPMPWDYLRDLGIKYKGRGPGHKIRCARLFINKLGFDVKRAAKHPACASARYFVDKLCALSKVW